MATRRGHMDCLLGGDMALQMVTDHGKAWRITEARTTEYRTFCEYLNECGESLEVPGTDLVYLVG